MVRLFICAALALSVCATPSFAGEKKKGEQVSGTIKKVDVEAGTLVVAVKVKKELTDKEVKIADDTKVTIVVGKEKKELTGKDGLKNELVKEGIAVAIVSKDGKVIEIRIGDAPKKGTTESGTIKKADAATGTLTAAIKNKKETADKEYK